MSCSSRPILYLSLPNISNYTLYCRLLIFTPFILPLAPLLHLLSPGRGAGGRGEGRQRSRSQSAERKGLPGSGGSGAIAGAAGLRIDKWRRALFMHTTILYDNDLFTPSDEGGSDDDSGSGSSDGGRARSDAGGIMLGARTGGGRGGGGKSRRGKQWRRKRNIVQRLVKCHFCKAGYVMQGSEGEKKKRRNSVYDTCSINRKWCCNHCYVSDVWIVTQP